MEGSTNTFDHVQREWTSEPTNHPYHATHHIELAHGTSPARVQEVLRRVRFRNFTDVLDTRLETLSIIYSNSWGTSHALAQLQTIGENDPPIPALDIYRTTMIYPDTNLFVISPRAKRPATVFFDLTPSNDPDHGSDFLIFTHAQDPGWETDRSTSRELRPGRHQFTLTAYDNDYTNTITRELEVITAGRALQLWKRGVRATVTDRRDRAAVLRPLNAAQDSYASGQLRAMFGHLDRFFSIALERDVTVYTSWVDTYHAMGAVLFP